MTQIEIINPIVGLSNEGDVELPFGSTELFIRARELDLWNSVRSLVEKNRAITYSLKEYKSIWQDLFQNSIYSHISGHKNGYYMIKPSESVVLMNKVVMIQELSSSLEKQISDVMSLADSVSSSIGPAMKDYFKEPFLEVVAKTI